MTRKEFWSDLFGRFIKPEEEEYEKFVEAELLYRMDALEYNGIDTVEKAEDWRKYKDYHNKLKDRWDGDFVA